MDLVRVRRREHQTVTSADTRGGSRAVHVRDQAPPHPGNVHLDDGGRGVWDFGDPVADLDRRVSFRPGDVRGPVREGRNHFARHALKEREACAVLVAPTAPLLAAAPPLPRGRVQRVQLRLPALPPEEPPPRPQGPPRPADVPPRPRVRRPAGRRGRGDVPGRGGPAVGGGAGHGPGGRSGHARTVNEDRGRGRETLEAPPPPRGVAGGRPRSLRTAGRERRGEIGGRSPRDRVSRSPAWPAAVWYGVGAGARRCGARGEGR
jgi:hypothetical protein